MATGLALGDHELRNSYHLVFNRRVWPAQMGTIHWAACLAASWNRMCGISNLCAGENYPFVRYKPVRRTELHCLCPSQVSLGTSSGQPHKFTGKPPRLNPWQESKRSPHQGQTIECTSVFEGTDKIRSIGCKSRKYQSYTRLCTFCAVLRLRASNFLARDPAASVSISVTTHHFGQCAPHLIH